MNFIDYYFRDLWYCHNGVFYNPLIPLDNSAFPAFLEANIGTDDMDVPILLVPYYTKCVAEGYDQIAFNLVNGPDDTGRRTIHRKTISTILREFYSAGTSSVRIAHVVTSKGVHYYGCKGLILDANFNPLLISTGTFRLQNGHLKITNPVCKVSYRVFNNSSELVEKTIIKQAIPLYSSSSVLCGTEFHNSTEGVEVVIGDFDYMVTKPAKQSMEMVSAKSVNDTILKCYDYI